MGQVIFFIFGGTKAVLEEKRPIPDEDYSPPVLPSYLKDIIEEHNRKTAAAAAAAIAFHQHYHGLTISPRRHHAASDQSAGDDLRQPRIAGDSLVASAATSGVEETEELIAKAAREGAASTERKKTKNKIPEIEEAIAFHRRYQVVATSPQQQPQQPVSDDQLAKDDLCRHLSATDHPIVAVNVEETKELITKAANEEATSSERKRRRRKKIAENVEETKELITKAANEEATSSERKRRRRRKKKIAANVEETKELITKAANEEATSSERKRRRRKKKIAANVEETKELITKAANEEATSSERKRRRRRRRRRKKKMAENITEPIRKKGPYASTHKILSVGEGDFSFSASLAAAFGYASNIVATSLNNKRYLRKNYTNAMANIEELESKGALVFHGVDASKMANHGQLLAGMKFDRIIFNFPHTGLFADSASHLSRNQMLVAGFLKNAKKMIEENGEIHVTHKTTRSFIKWKIVELASMVGLRLVEEVPFHHRVYRGYRTKHGFGGNKNFHCHPCSSYRFGLIMGRV